MNYKNYLWPFVASVILLQGCGGDNLLGNDNSIDPLSPEPPAIDYTTVDRPNENASVMTTDERYINKSNGDRSLLRGVELNYYINPEEKLAALDAIAGTGANVVRLLIDVNISSAQLQAALDKVLELKLMVIVSMTDEEEQLTCSDDLDYIMDEALVNYWFGEWHSVLIQDKYQPYLMINVAKGWGPKKVYSDASRGYDNYVDVYKAIIGVFRNAGFKVPLVIDAPDCGADFNAFLSGRGQRLLATDIEKNLVLAANASTGAWNSDSRLSNAFTRIAQEKIPFFMSAFAGSEVGDADQHINHLSVMDLAVGDGGMRLDFQWGSEEDGAVYVTALPEATDLTSGAISLDVFLDRPLLEYRPIEGSVNFAPYGTMTIGTFIRDADGNELLLFNTESRNVQQYLWNTLRGNIPEEIDAANLLVGTEFDTTKVTHVGVRVMANGKVASINGDIQIDNLRLLPGAPPMVELDFSESDEGWAATWGTTPTVGHEAGALTVLPTADNFAIAIAKSTVQSIDFTKQLEISFDVFVPADYTGPQWANMFANFGMDSSIQPKTPVSISAATPGHWTTITTPVNWSGEYDVSLPQNLLFQIGGFSGTESSPILFDNFVVEDVNALPTKVVTITQFFEGFRDGVGAWEDSDGWGGAAALGTVEDFLAVSVPSSNPGGAINFPNINSVQEIDLGGPITVKFNIFLPSDFDNPDAYFNLFMQDGSWNHFEITSISVADLTLGELNEIEVSVADDGFPDGFSRALKPNMFGVQYGDIVNGGVFLLDSFQIIGNTVVDDLEPIFEVEFSEETHVAAFNAESATGTFDANSADAAKSFDWRTIPFGWTASTWFGAENDEIGLDITNTINSSTDLTERGEEIVNGENGISATAN